MRAPYQYISADTHLECPPELWRDRVPAQHRERAPRTIRLADGTDAWLIEGGPLYQGGSNMAAGRPYDEWHPDKMKYEGQAGAGSQQQRLVEEDMDGMDAEVLYCSVGGRSAWNRISDDEAYFAVVRAYNDFLAEDYCAAAPDRLIGMGIIPERGLQTAVSELEHCSKIGLKGVNINKFPSGRMYPTLEDDRFWATALDLNMPVTIHTALSDDGGRGQRGGEPSDPAIAVARRSSSYAIRGAPAVILMAVTGVFVRLPKLEIYLAENQIGWVPNCIEQTDMIYKQRYPWRQRHEGFKPLPELPSHYLRHNVLWGFYDNPIGVQLRHYIGVDRILWSSDFPHAPTEWPNSLDVIERNFAGVAEDETHLMVAGNAIRFFHLESTFETTEERERQMAARRSGAAPSEIAPAYAGSYR